MIIGSVRCELLIYNVHSLKEKRSVLKSVQTRLKQRFNLSVAETDFQDVWQRAELSIVTVGNTRTICEKELQRATALIDSEERAERTLTDYEWL
ncbi:hypothetical protein AJ85_05125 [Alkalihalobacillus alcalophilus ATCC 27647 = CGMCC 1.3604]|uniref:YlxP-like protein n=1 Tax=Alkalihalobacillus alcalophilus ATCC 27647 = CGMCC 1.3604 TaxID=1218173 RepID=A0A094WKD7_ALKAL|nr:DUF503 family protein [Alkalihalobacillus alcalophilus]KGA98209.1 hypothetical protein BALCAV_0205450 [Alkalihalobacillus alcalophilus ATCC 27647 = CGMCC 1.3604]MED1562148.1 DUF503 family protein [Alkalihalobacillus alcalophilus]THG91373.1 hypothetical protein AJ85_05125 [Alkalihalobacillus alcalophilus ATCC 27647 = CGMCC 1.3604]